MRDLKHFYLIGGIQGFMTSVPGAKLDQNSLTGDLRIIVRERGKSLPWSFNEGCSLHPPCCHTRIAGHNQHVACTRDRFKTLLPLSSKFSALPWLSSWAIFGVLFLLT